MTRSILGQLVDLEEQIRERRSRQAGCTNRRGYVIQLEILKLIDAGELLRQKLSLHLQHK